MAATADLSQRAADGWLDLNFHAGQIKAWESTARTILVLAGTQAGKSSWGPYWLVREIAERGPGDYMVVAPTFPLLSLKVLPEFLRLFKTGLRLGNFTGSPIRRFTFSNYGCKSFWGHVPERPTQVFFCHATDPDSLESATAKAAWLDEAGQKKFRLDSYLAIKRRLAINQGRVLITTTPYGLGWLKTELWDRWKSGDPAIDVVQFASTMNPSFPQAEYERARQTLPAWKFDLFYRAVFTRPAGVIYDCFDTERHVLPSFAIPGTWPRFVGLDFGGINTAAVFLAGELDQRGAETGRLFAYRCYHAGGRTAKEHAQQLLKGEPRIPFCVGGSKGEGQWRQEFAAGGLPVLSPLISEVEVGIDRVYGTIKRGELIVLKGAEGCDALIDDLQSYSRELDDSGEPTEKIEDKDSWHRCFVAGTRVATNRGAVPIEDVRVGMQVLTRQGYRHVVCWGETPEQQVWEVVFNDGRRLVGTPDHPVWVRGRGFVKIDALRYNDEVETDELLGQEAVQCASRKSACLGWHGSATLIQRIHQIEGISATETSGYIGEFGRSTMGQFLTGSTFTTRMRIPGTTPSATLNCSIVHRICDTTTPENARAQRGRILLESARWQPRGTGHQKGERGIANMLPSQQRAVSRDCIRASGAESNTCRKSTGNPSSIALANAVPMQGEILGLMTLPFAAPFAAKRSPKTDTAGRRIAPVVVRCSPVIERRTVFNLTVADAHEYFANGVLVSNCDALRYIVGRIRGNKRELNIFT